MKPLITLLLSVISLFSYGQFELPKLVEQGDTICVNNVCALSETEVWIDYANSEVIQRHQLDENNKTIDNQAKLIINQSEYIEDLIGIISEVENKSAEQELLNQSIVREYQDLNDEVKDISLELNNSQKNNRLIIAGLIGVGVITVLR